MPKQKLVYDIGLCDAPTRIGTDPQFKSYEVWKSMLRRVYGIKELKRNPTYMGCRVDKRWHKYSEFIKFHDKHYRDGYQLDKDILVPGNKKYGPDTCMYVPQAVNKLFINRARFRGKYPLGIIRVGNILVVQINGQATRHVASFALNEVDAAVACYNQAKAEQVIAMARQYKDVIDKRVYKSLMWRARNHVF
jgi:hypothetical protein